MVYVQADSLRGFAIAILEAVGYPSRDAADMAECLLTASLRGVDTHGVSRLPAYVRVVQSGKCPAGPPIRVVKDAGAVALMDGGGGFGFVPALRAMRLAMDKARTWGIGAVGVRNSSHFGMAACYPLEAVQQGMLGLAMSNADPLIAPPGFRTRMVGNNPIALAAPTGDGGPLILDIATSAASMAKIRRARTRAQRIPVGWGVDAAGRPTDDPNAIIEGGALLPFADHKGFGIALFVEVFSAILTGGPFGHHAHAGLHYGGSPEDKCGHFLAAVNISALLPEEEFRTRMRAWIAELKAHAGVEGGEQVRLPGERAHKEHLRRLVEGIPLSAEEAEGLKGIADEFSVPVPWATVP